MTRYSIPSRVVKVIENLNQVFWDAWREEASYFPDNSESDNLSLYALKASILSVSLNYLMGYEKEYRVEQLEELINSLRIMESKLRDLE